LEECQGTKEKRKKFLRRLRALNILLPGERIEKGKGETKDRGERGNYQTNSIVNGVKVHLAQPKSRQAVWDLRS